MLDVYKKKRWVTIPASGDGMLFRVDKAKKDAVLGTASFLAIIPQKTAPFCFKKATRLLSKSKPNRLPLIQIVSLSFSILGLMATAHASFFLALRDITCIVLPPATRNKVSRRYLNRDRL